MKVDVATVDELWPRFFSKKLSRSKTSLPFIKTKRMYMYTRYVQSMSSNVFATFGTSLKNVSMQHKFKQLVGKQRRLELKYLKISDAKPQRLYCASNFPLNDGVVHGSGWFMFWSMSNFVKVGNAFSEFRKKYSNMHAMLIKECLVPLEWP